MQIRNTLLTAATSAFLLTTCSAVVLAQNPNRERGGERGERNEHAAPSTRPSGQARPASLHNEMEEIGRLFKALQKQVKDPSQNASTIQLVEQFQQHTLTAKSSLPKKVTSAPETDQKQLAADYHKMMSNLLRHALDLEDQLRDNENDKAAKTLEEMNDLQKEGHKEFRPQRKRG